MPLTINDGTGPLYPSLIVVEGKDDDFFVRALLDEIPPPNDPISIHAISGVGNLQPKLSGLVKNSQFIRGVVRRLIVLRDSDTNPQAALQDAENILSGLGVGGPYDGSAPNSAGQRITVLLVPSSTSDGNLEKLLFDTVAATPLGVATSKFFSANGPTGIAANDAHKRLVQIFLACQTNECRGPGRAYQLGQFDHNATAIVALRNALAAALTP